MLIENGRGTQAVHDAVVAMRAARRSGTANTKTKADVNLSGAKPWRQKGTGRARAGYKSLRHLGGGGVVFGPHPRDYSKKVSKTVKRLAFRKALSERIIAGDVLTVETSREGSEDQGVRQPDQGSYRREEGADRLGLVRRDTYRRRATCSRCCSRPRRREHRATARVRQDHRVTGRRSSNCAERTTTFMNEPYDLIQTVQLTEKASLLGEKLNKYVFRVARARTRSRSSARSSCSSRRRSSDVNTCNYAGKKKRERRADFGRKAHWKKAIVTLKEGEKIDLV